jgi:hypothetical protein
MDDDPREPDSSGEDPWSAVLLMRTWSDGEAEMVRRLLEAYAIPCQVVSDVPHTVLPLSVDGLGEVRILVARRNLESARALLADHLRQGFRMVRGGLDSPDGSPEDEGGEPGIDEAEG